MKNKRRQSRNTASLAKKTLRPEREPMASPTHQMVSDDGKPALPKGWVWARLGGICLVQGGFAFKSKDYKKSGIPLLRISNISDLEVQFDRETVYLEPSVLEQYNDFTVSPGDIVLALSGATTGKYGVYKKNKIALLNQRVARIRSFIASDISNTYIFYYLDVIRSQILKKAYGAAQPNISTNEIADFIIPLPPLPEQHRIVAKIEELFTKLDAGVAELKKAKAQLQRYRQSVLKDAFSGKLTEAWREAHKAELEPAAVLLERIKEERKMNAKGKYKEPPPVDASNLPELPEGWVWARLDQLPADEPNSITDGPFGSNLKTAHYTAHGPRVIRLQNIGEGKFHDEKAHISEEHFRRLRRHEIFAGELVIAALGENSPRACIIPEFVGPAIVKADCIRFKPHRSMTDSKYLDFVLNSKQLKKFAAMIIHGVGRPRLNQQEIRSLPIPIAPLSEQHLIIEEIERRFSIAEEVEKIVDQSLKQAERLRQSILQRAFAGQLVPQDPNDEPAEKLLERIKAEKAKREEKTK